MSQMVQCVDPNVCGVKKYHRPGTRCKAADGGRLRGMSWVPSAAPPHQATVITPDDGFRPWSPDEAPDPDGVDGIPSPEEMELGIQAGMADYAWGGARGRDFTGMSADPEAQRKVQRLMAERLSGDPEYIGEEVAGYLLGDHSDKRIPEAYAEVAENLAEATAYLQRYPHALQDLDWDRFYPGHAYEYDGGMSDGHHDRVASWPVLATAAMMQDREIEAHKNPRALLDLDNGVMLQADDFLNNSPGADVYDAHVLLPQSVDGDEGMGEQAESIVAYAAQASFRGETLGSGHKGRRVNLSHDSTKARRSQWGGHDFEDNLGQMIVWGTPVRKTNRAGEGTAGTRAVEGLGADFAGDVAVYYA